MLLKNFKKNYSHDIIFDNHTYYPGMICKDITVSFFKRSGDYYSEKGFNNGVFNINEIIKPMKNNNILKKIIYLIKNIQTKYLKTLKL